MEMRYPLAEGRGLLSVREEGGRVVCRAELPDDGRGLYKAYLSGAAGRIALGTLLPEGGRLQLVRTLSADKLTRRGVWPPTGGGVELAFVPASRQGSGSNMGGWVREPNPQSRMGDPLLAGAAAATGSCLLRREGEGLALAFPWRVGAPFPVAPLFCFAHPMEMGGDWYAIFHLNGRGCPIFPHKDAQ